MRRLMMLMLMRCLLMKIRCKMRYLMRDLPSMREQPGPALPPPSRPSPPALLGELEIKLREKRRPPWRVLPEASSPQPRTARRSATHLRCQEISGTEAKTKTKLRMCGKSLNKIFFMIFSSCDILFMYRTLSLKRTKN